MPRVVGRVLVAAAVVGGLMLAPPPALGYHNVAPGLYWTAHPGSGYTYHIPACLHPNYDGGPPWRLWRNMHARANDALHAWDDIGGELYFNRTDTSCQSLYNNGIPYVQIGWSPNLGTELIAWCQNIWVWGPIPGEEQRAAVWLDMQDQALFWWGDGPAPAGKSDAAAVLAHELGHTLVLLHSDHPDDTMFDPLPQGSVSYSYRTPTYHDEQGYAYHYGWTH